MKCRTRIWFVSALAALLASLHAVPLEAAQKVIETTGTSSGSGHAGITIESFAPNGPNRRAADASISQAMTFINVAIPSGSTPANSSILIRNDVDAALSAEYIVTIPGGSPNFVLIDRPGGSFTMGISEDVPGQTIAEFIPNNVPLLGDRGMLAASLVL